MTRYRQFALRVGWCIALTTMVFPPVSAIAENGVCVGYYPESNAFGTVGTSSSTKLTDCPKHHVMLFVEVPRGEGSPENYSINAVCCELPSDVLSEEVAYSQYQCPENFVATGTREDLSEIDWRRRRKELRCSKINTERYRLSATTSGILIGPTRGYIDRLGMLLGFSEPPVIAHRGQLPASIRYAVGREGSDHWGLNSCGGAPWGSLFVGRDGEGANCNNHLFRQLVLAVDRSPVQWFATCRAVAHPTSYSARCVP